jgi:hypothetical protein
MSTLQHLRQQNIVRTAIKTMTKPNHPLTAYFYRHRTKDYEKHKSLPTPFPTRSKKLLNLIGLGRTLGLTINITGKRSKQHSSPTTIQMHHQGEVWRSEFHIHGWFKDRRESRMGSIPR